MENATVYPQKPKRVFTILSILSIINISFELYDQFRAVIIGKLSSEQVDRMIQNAKELTTNIGAEDVYGIFEKMYAVQRIQNDLFTLSHTIGILTLLVGMAGVVMMLKSNAIGFQLYIVYSLLSTFGIIFYIPFDFVPFPLIIVNIFISLLLIFLYYTNRTWKTEKDIKE